MAEKRNLIISLDAEVDKERIAWMDKNLKRWPRDGKHGMIRFLIDLAIGKEKK